jgi:hypothetical protein
MKKFNQDDLCSFESSQVLKKLGFDLPCNYSYEGNMLSKTYKPFKNSDDPSETTAPTYKDAIEWLTTEYGMTIHTEYVEIFEIFLENILNSNEHETPI